MKHKTVGSRLCVELTGEGSSKSLQSANESETAPNSLSEEIAPADWIIKAEVRDTPAKPRTTGAAGPRPELPLTPGSPLLPGARGVICWGKQKKGWGRQHTTPHICRAPTAFLTLASALPKQGHAASRAESAPGIGMAFSQFVTPAEARLTALSELRYLSTYCTFYP